MRTTRITLESRHMWIPLALLFLAVQLIPSSNGSAFASESTLSSPNLEVTGGSTDPPAIACRSLAGRHRLEFRVGYWDSGRYSQLRVVHVEDEEMTRVEDLVGAFSYAYWVEDQLATDVTFRGLVAEALSIEGASGTYESAVVVTSAIFGISLYPISSARTPLRPYITAGVGPYLGVESYKETDNRVTENVKTLGTFGGYVGGGVDIQMGRHVMAGIRVGYNVMADFPEPIGPDDNYSGFELSTGISLLLGEGKRR